jgi:hypothetical protein
VPTSGDVVIPAGPTTTPLNVPTVTLNSLTLNNGLGIRLVGDVTLTSFLRVSNGIVDAQTNNRVVIVQNNNTATAIRNAANAAITYTNTNSYVAGRLDRAVLGGTTYLWPIGTLTTPQFAAIDLAGVTGGLSRIEGRFRANTPAAFVPAEHFFENGALFNIMLPDGYWTFNPNTGNASFNMELWPNFGFGCCAVYTFVKKHTPASPWDRDGSTGVYPTANGISAIGSLRRNGFASFSDVAIVGSLIPLPVEGLQLSATPEGNNAELTWFTTAEYNNQGFSVEHSTDAQAFDPLGFVPSQGEGAALRNYRYRHENLQPGNHYYRLRQQDLNGQFSYSNTVQLQMGAAAEALATLYPNPTQGLASLRLTGLAVPEVQVAMVNQLGQTVQTYALSLEAGNGTLALDASRLPKGVYYLKVTGQGNTLFNLRMVVQ